MITQSLVGEIELALLRSYARASRKVVPFNKREQHNFVGSATYQGDFLKEFMAGMKEKREILEEEIRRGNYRNCSVLADKVYQIVEERMKTALAGKALHQQELDEASFNRMIWELRREVSKVFY